MYLICEQPFIHAMRGYHPGHTIGDEVGDERKAELVKSGKARFVVKAPKDMPDKPVPIIADAQKTLAEAMRKAREQALAEANGNDDDEPEPGDFGGLEPPDEEDEEPYEVSPTPLDDVEARPKASRGPRKPKG